jgi:hypothetical protein
MLRLAMLVALAALSVGVSACDSDTAAPACATLSPDTRISTDLAVEPGTAGAGSTLTLRFDPDVDRGVAFTLAPHGDGCWGDVEYYLTSDRETDDNDLLWWRANGNDLGGHGYHDLGVSADTPDQVELPPRIPAGRWNLCTANTRIPICADLTIID